MYVLSLTGLVINNHNIPLCMRLQVTERLRLLYKLELRASSGHGGVWFKGFLQLDSPFPLLRFVQCQKHVGWTQYECDS